MGAQYGTNHAENLTGGSGEDYLWAYGGDDWLFGRGGNDYLIGGRGADRMDGGDGRDQANYQDSSTGVMVFLYPGLGFGGTAEGDVLVNIENLGGSKYNDVLSGDGNYNQLYGRGGNDTLKGGGGYDHLSGDAGDDILMGGIDGDYLSGGSGADTASYEGSSVGVLVSLLHNVGAYGEAEGDSFVSIENVTGSGHADNLWGDDGINVLNGMNGDDTLKGFGGNDTLRGESGHDYLNGGVGRDTMIGGLGNDTYIVDDGYDMVVETAGQGLDVVRTSTTYMLPFFGEIEWLETTDPNGTAPLELYGNSIDNQITGNNGDNLIEGGGGADRMIGRGGNDTYYVNSANDTIVENGGHGIDTVITGVSYTLTPGADVEILRTVDYYETPINLTGNANGNVVRGNNGNNVVNGGDGRDELIGLGGQDSFLFNTVLNAAANVDRIVDFNVADDTIQLDRAIFSSSLGLGNISAGEFVIGMAAQDANDRIIYDSNTGALYYDNDGVGGNAQVQFAEVGRNLALTNLDFLVVSSTAALPRDRGLGDWAPPGDIGEPASTWNSTARPGHDGSYPACLKYRIHSEGSSTRMNEPTRRSRPLIVRSAALRNHAFKGWNTSSIGLNSGEYCGRYLSSAPAAWMISCTPVTLWKETLSRITMSRRLSVGTRKCSR
jgi:Ca2+-binding RTX toxin-like protein